jgi:hypothetical protein
MRSAGFSSFGISCLLAMTAVACGSDSPAASAGSSPSTASSTTATTTTASSSPERDPAALVEPLARVMEQRGDLNEVVYPEGLTVLYGATQRHYRPEQLKDILRNGKPEGWNPGACDDECLQGTFTEVVAESLLGAFRDPDRRIDMNKATLGPNTLAGLGAFPPDLAELDYVSVHDPGDDPQYDGLDWTTWLVFVQEHDGRQVVAGLRQYAWEP